VSQRWPIDFDDIRCFLKIVEEGSFVHAAAQLGMSPPTVTRRIQKLEENFRSVFFLRGKERATLTHAGHTFLDYAVSLADTIESANEEFSLNSLYRPRLRIGAVSSVLSGFVAPAVAKVKLRFPNAKIEIFDAPSRRIQDMLESNSIDLALTYTPLDEALHLQVPIARDPFVIIEPSQLPPGATRIASLADLGRLHGIAARRGGGVRMMVERHLRQLGVKVDWDFEVQNLVSVISLVSSGLGWAIVPMSALASADTRKLNVVSLAGFALDRSIYAARIERFEMNGPSKYMWNCLVSPDEIP
jgi:DNA-binding transcriptional LysR family regulator